MHLKSDNIDVIGSSLIGVPGVIIGRTKQFAWGVTTVGADVQDIFLIDEVDEGGYMYKNQYVPYTIRTEEIPLANGKTVRTLFFPLTINLWKSLSNRATADNTRYKRNSIWTSYKSSSYKFAGSIVTTVNSYV